MSSRVLTPADVTSDASREVLGWRRGRPLEDPAKTKRWGFITAKPSEFLVHCRQGRVLRTSGQGATCFKWPWDSVAIVPTSLQRLQFTADQVTLERVGVLVKGLAVYRIAEPLLAYRVMNFSYPERAQEKLREVLTEMLVGASRRLIANLEVDECLQKRKVALADELLEEIAPVIGGEGRVEDSTDKGWGVVLDTVEIQEVKVLSESVFSAMQAPYRALLDRRAREARAESEKASELSEAASKRDIEEARISAEAAVRAKKASVERDDAERRADEKLHRLSLEKRESEEKIARERELMELELEQERAKVTASIAKRRLAVDLANADIEAYETTKRATELQSALERVAWESRLEKKRTEETLMVELGKQEAELDLVRARAMNERASAKARVITAKQLPELAGAVGQKFGEIKITQLSDAASPFASVAHAVSGILELVKE